MDRPWSQYFCCMVATRIGSSSGSIRWPTKRALRAILKATDVCALEPEQAARCSVDKGLYTTTTMPYRPCRMIPYNRWREYDPEDTVRFYALRLHEAGMIKTSPQKIIAQGSRLALSQ